MIEAESKQLAGDHQEHARFQSVLKAKLFIKPAVLSVASDQPFGIGEMLFAPAHKLFSDALPLIFGQHKQVIDDGAENRIAEYPDGAD